MVAEEEAEAAEEEAAEEAAPAPAVAPDGVGVGAATRHKRARDQFVFLPPF